ncbi:MULTISPECIES: hypothetical protein [Paenibacillus]|uniref:Uncharacterized protein n=1 Tax=Paenibacillus campinasensis TaxID=66347 RepID=A0A268EIB0_9BACL|nr:hypothetical protein [Paenibacillus campinasensis]MUG67311.1 hypothetical protein [Paenibacillus campinasensis]PAD72804.1 hypothetical protein CHH67_21490 [Paenibacillus campinasensis]
MGHFELKIVHQHFLTQELEEPCSHGPIYLKVNDVMISSEDDGDWVINEAALALMRTVRYGFPNPLAAPPRYYPEGIKEETLINCCGAYMLFCSSYIKWNVTLNGDEVTLSHFVKNDHVDYRDLAVTLPLAEYATIVYAFAEQASDFYIGKDVDAGGMELFEGQYGQFWQEFEEHMKYIKEKYIL